MALFRPWWTERVRVNLQNSKSNARGRRKLEALIVYFESTNWILRLCGVKPKEVNAEPWYGFEGSPNSQVEVIFINQFSWIIQANEAAGKNKRIGFVVIAGEDGQIFFSGSTRKLVSYHNQLSLR